MDRFDQGLGSYLPLKNPIDLYWENVVNTLAPSFYYSIILVLSGNEDMHESLDEFKFRPNITTNSRVNWIFFILAGIEDMHESLDEFEFRLICNSVTALD